MSAVDAKSDRQPPSRRSFIGAATVTMGVAGVGAFSWPLADQLAPSTDIRARPRGLFDLKKVAAGGQASLLWQGRPVFVRHRTAAEIAAASADDHVPMKQPQLDADRVKAGWSAWLVVAGDCTFDFCTTSYGEGPFGGWLCHCCGSVYDLSGRVRQGPAPRNLVVPPYEFPDDHTVQLA
jgi:ubiquinol-cytochrome c reductase iron-sulfur subunit